MKRQLRTTAAVVVLAAMAGAPALAQTSGPKAVYWLSADTSTGMGGMMGMAGVGGMDRNAMIAQARAQAEAENGSGGDQSEQESTGSLVGGALGGSMGSAIGGMFGHKKKPGQQQQPQQHAQAPAPAYRPAANYSHSLSLQLGSMQHPTGAPSAEHLVPAGLQVGPSLPLVTPTTSPPERGQYQIPQQFQRPNGRILIFWGCGEHAAAPITIDMATMSAAKVPPFPTIAVNPPQPPSPSRYAAYGVWPNEQSAVQVPAGGSLVGSHTVRSDYSPEINFAMDQAHDFMAPLNISAAPRTPSGATPVSWNAVPGATGYFAWFMGTDPSRGTDNMTMVMWTSSAKAAFMGGLMDYLPPSEVRRLIAAAAVMPPSTTQCTVPAEVLQAAPMGMLSMIAYGDEMNLADPPKPATPKTPWNLVWTVKARFKSTAMTMLGMPGMGG